MGCEYSTKKRAAKRTAPRRMDGGESQRGSFQLSAYAGGHNPNRRVNSRWSDSTSIGNRSATPANLPKDINPRTVARHKPRDSAFSAHNAKLFRRETTVSYRRSRSASEHSVVDQVMPSTSRLVSSKWDTPRGSISSTEARPTEDLSCVESPRESIASGSSSRRESPEVIFIEEETGSVEAPVLDLTVKVPESESATPRVSLKKKLRKKKVTKSKKTKKVTKKRKPLKKKTRAKSIRSRSKSVRKKVLVKAPKPALQKKTTLKVESSKAKGSSETELQKLDSESTRLTEKLSNLNAKREDLWGTKGHDHPSVKKITRQINTLSKKLRDVSMRRYTLRSG